MSTFYPSGSGSAAAPSLAADGAQAGGADWTLLSIEDQKDEETMGGAAEHVLLAPEELPELRRRGQPHSQSLHAEARTSTNRFASGASEHVGVQADLAAEWENWKMYIATRKNAEELVGPGVVSFTAEFIEGTGDPNRGGIPRLDLVLRHSDGGYVRLRAGSRPKNDAVPRFFPGSAPEHAPRVFPGSAPEHAAYEWRAPGAGGIFSAARAKLVPQVDKLGKEDVWQTVQILMAQEFRISETGPGSISRTGHTSAGGSGSATWANSRGVSSGLACTVLMWP